MEMPLTPEELRPMARISLSAKRQQRPFLAAIMMSLLPSVSSASSSSSPSRTLIAMIPLLRLRLLAYSVSVVFLTVPLRVTRVTKWLSVYSGFSIERTFR